MDKFHIPLLAEVLELYYSEDELREMAAIFDVTLHEETVGRFPRFNWLVFCSCSGCLASKAVEERPGSKLHTWSDHS